MIPQPAQFSKLKIAVWNADALNTKRYELEEFISRNQIDIIAVNETQLTPGCSMNLLNFTTYRADRLNNEGGGTAIFIKNNIDHSDLGREILIQLEANSIIVNLANQTKLKLTSVYGPPGYALETKDLDTIFNTDIPTLAIGDFNAKNRVWNSTKNNNRGNKLLKYITKENLIVYSPDQPTFYHRNNYPPDWLDIAITNSSNIVDITALDELSSDHVPVIMNLDISSKVYQQNTRKIIDWDLYKTEIEEKYGNNTIPKNPTEIDTAIKKLSELIIHATDESSRIITPSPSNHLDVPKWLQLLIKQKNIARKKWQSTRSSADKSNFYKLNYEVRSELRKIKNKTWNTLIEAIETTDDVQ